jgi:hypothetical protein
LLFVSAEPGDEMRDGGKGHHGGKDENGEHEWSATGGRSRGGKVHRIATFIVPVALSSREWGKQELNVGSAPRFAEARS